MFTGSNWASGVTSGGGGGGGQGKELILTGQAAGSVWSMSIGAAGAGGAAGGYVGTAGGNTSLTIGANRAGLDMKASTSAPRWSTPGSAVKAASVIFPAGVISNPPSA